MQTHTKQEAGSSDPELKDAAGGSSANVHCGSIEASASTPIKVPFPHHPDNDQPQRIMGWHGMPFSNVDHFCTFMNFCAIIVNDLCYILKQYLHCA